MSVQRTEMATNAVSQAVCKVFLNRTLSERSKIFATGRLTTRTAGAVLRFCRPTTVTTDGFRVV